MTTVPHQLSEHHSPARADRADLRFGSIPKLALLNAERFSDREALVEPGRRLTYRDVAAEMLRACEAMLAIGARPGDRIALWAPNSPQWVIGALAAQATGGVLIPINTRLLPAEAAYILDKTDATMVLTMGEFLGRDYAGSLDSHRSSLPKLRHVITIDDVPSEGALTWTSLVSGASGSTARAEASVGTVAGEQLSDIMFTSGTTGQPKGVMLTHAQSLRGFWGLNVGYGVAEHDRLVAIAPFSHSFGYKAGWLLCFMVGACVHPQPVLDVDTLLDVIAEERITVVPGPPTVFHGLFNAAGRSGHDMTSIRLCYVGATTVPPDLVKRLYKELGVERVCTGYGLTEATAVATTTEPGDDAEHVANWCGRPVEGVAVRVADDTSRPVPVGKPGEVQVLGYNVMKGYLNDPEATAAAMTGDGWLRTGDVGVMDEIGRLRIVDRIKDIFIAGGFNVSSAEVERTLSDHEAIEEAAVVGMPDERLGEVGAVFVVPRPGQHLTESSLIEWCRERMANYKVPRYVAFCDELPRNATGKVVKGELRSRLAGRHPHNESELT